MPRNLQSRAERTSRRENGQVFADTSRVRMLTSSLQSARTRHCTRLTNGQRGRKDGAVERRFSGGDRLYKSLDSEGACFGDGRSHRCQQRIGTERLDAIRVSDDRDFTGNGYTGFPQSPDSAEREKIITGDDSGKSRSLLNQILDGAIAVFDLIPVRDMIGTDRFPALYCGNIGA